MLQRVDQWARPSDQYVCNGQSIVSVADQVTNTHVMDDLSPANIEQFACSVSHNRNVAFLLVCFDVAAKRFHWVRPALFARQNLWTFCYSVRKEQCMHNNSNRLRQTTLIQSIPVFSRYRYFRYQNNPKSASRVSFFVKKKRILEKSKIGFQITTDNHR